MYLLYCYFNERELVPKFLRLGFHDCVGGCDGCIDISNPDNRGLDEPIEAISYIVDKYKGSYSRADIWALATLISADKAVLDARPEGLTFPMTFIGRRDCKDADAKGYGGPQVDMPLPDLTTHELLKFFGKTFGFSSDETVAIMGAHAVAIAHRDNVGFGNIGKEDGWVFDAKEYILNNRYYDVIVGDYGDVVESAITWEQELVHNEGDIPSRYQWYHESADVEERPIMTNSDIALVRDLTYNMSEDENGIPGKVNCFFNRESQKLEMASSADETPPSRRLGSQSHICPVASSTIEKALEYKMDNALFLHDFQKALDKMLRSGYT